MPSPAECLEGLILEGGWEVEPLIPKNPALTGGNFSQSYTAKNKAGKKVFVKALDFTRAFVRGSNQTQVLQEVTAEFNFEVAIVELCASKSMDRVVRALGSGTADVDNSLLGQVPYLIFEYADRDIRKHLDAPGNATLLAWKLRSLHHITTGLKQLHSAEIAHQDLKPSNVLVFEEFKGARVSKLADLGRASRNSGLSPFDHLAWAGDPNYAPPEVHFSFYEPDWHRRRIAYDIYMLGSIVSFLFVRTTAIASLLQALPNPFWPGHWNGTFEEVLPYLNSAFSDVQNSFSNQIPTSLATDLTPVYSQLCEPDPRKRGHPGQALNKISLERFITKFDVMARKAELGRYGS